MIVCPFCNEDDFDLIGLKLHLLRWCDAYNEVDTSIAWKQMTGTGKYNIDSDSEFQKLSQTVRECT